MKKNLLPILLIGGALAFMYFRRRPRVTVTADVPIKQTAEEFEGEFAETVKPGPTLLDKATDVVKNIFGKDARQKAAKQAQRTAVKRAAQKGITKKKAKAVTKELATFKFPKIGGDEVFF
jgi:hypothetical protein